MNIAGYEKAEVFMVLFNRATPQGLGFIHYKPRQINIEEAREVVKGNENLSFDYAEGRVMKVSLKEDHVDTRLYNRDNGNLAAENAWDDYLEGVTAASKNSSVQGGGK